MPPATVCVFVSSTWLDLQPAQKAVEAALHRLRETKFVGMEYFGSRDESTHHASLDEVGRSQVYVGIFGGRYGSGITEAEYRRARDRPKTGQSTGHAERRTPSPPHHPNLHNPRRPGREGDCRPAPLAL